MVKASLRTGAADATAQRTVATAAAQPAPTAATPAPAAPRPPVRGAAPVKPGVIHTRGGAPARPTVTVAAPVATAAPVAAPATRAPARGAVAAPVATAAPAAAPKPAPVTVTAPARRQVVKPVAAPVVQVAAAALAPEPPVVEAPVIEIQAEVVETPVAEVQVETITTIAPEAGQSVEEQLVGEADAGPVDPAEAEPVAAPSAAVVVRPPASVARVSGNDGTGLTGDWGQEDLRFPRLTIVRGSGALSQQFNDGTLLYADQELLPPPSVVAGAQNPVLWFAPLQIDKGWRENLSQEEQASGQLPRNAATVAEVEAMGGTTLWVGGQKPNWSPSARCVLLLEKPEGVDHPGFVLPLDGRDYAVALFYVSGGDFNAFAKLIYNTAKTVLQVPVLDAAGQPVKDERQRILKTTMLHKNFWTMQYAKVKRGEYQVWSPVARLLAKEETGPEVRQYVENLFGGGVAAAAGEQD